MACSSSLLSSSVGRFICLSWSKASSFIFWRIRVISYWILKATFYSEKPRKDFLSHNVLKTSGRMYLFILWIYFWKIYWNLFYLIHPLYPFGGQFFGDTDGSFRIQTDPWHQGHSIISQLKNTKVTLLKHFIIQHDDDENCMSKSYHEGKRQYLIKLLMWLAESRMVPSKREQRKWEKDRSSTKWASEYQESDKYDD